MNNKKTATTIDEINTFDSYEAIKNFVNNYLTKTNKTNNKSPKKESNDNSIKVFIKNANLLKNYDSTVLKKTTVFHFSKNIIQYYLLNEARLIAYVGFRTQVRNEVVPTINKFNEFLLLYLMEIVNGIYGDTYDEKRCMLDKTLYLANEKKSYRELIIEAYEILYLQYSKDLELNSFQKGISLSVFEGYKFVDKNYTNVYEPTAEHLFKELGPYLTGSYDKDSKSRLKASFDFVYYELKEDDLYNIGGQGIDEIFAFESEEIADSPLNKIKALYPTAIQLFFVDNDGEFHFIKKGAHGKKIYFHEYRRKMLIEYVFESIMVSLEKFCSDYEYDDDDEYGNLDNSAMADRLKANIFGNYDPEEMQQLIDDAVERWVSTDPKFLKVLCSLPFDIIDDWMEEHKFDPTTIPPRKEKELKGDNKTNNTKELKDGEISQSDIKKFVKRLDEMQFGVICIFLNLSQYLGPGSDTRNNPFITIQIISINKISSKIFGEDIIQKNKIVDKYKKMLIKEIVG